MRIGFGRSESPPFRHEPADDEKLRRLKRVNHGDLAGAKIIPSAGHGKPGGAKASLQHTEANKPVQPRSVDCQRTGSEPLPDRKP